jgi:hypothetical protein
MTIDVHARQIFPLTHELRESGRAQGGKLALTID